MKTENVKAAPKHKINDTKSPTESFDSIAKELGWEKVADAPQADAPQADAPQADAPQADAPQADAPQADAPQADAPQELQADAAPIETQEEKIEKIKSSLKYAKNRELANLPIRELIEKIELGSVLKINMEFMISILDDGSAQSKSVILKLISKARVLASL